MLYQKDEQKRLEQCEENWPAAYYEEFDKEIRKEMLEKIATSETIQDDLLTIRQQLWELRYGKRAKQTMEIDYFIKGIVTLKSILLQSDGILGRKKQKKILEEAKEDLQMNMYEQSDADVQSVLEAEWMNVAAFYYHICVEDKNFSTGALGFFKLKDEQVINKVAEEAISLALRVPRAMQQEKEFACFSNCVLSVFENTFHGGKSIIEEKRAKLKI